MAQLWYSPISINAAQVPSTQTDFPVLVSVTDARFKDVAHSGHVNRSDGFDLRPYTDSTLVTAITGYELEHYNASTGEVVMWVKVSSLSSSTTPFVLAYGDSGISTDGSSTTTWSNSFTAIYHLRNGTTLSVADSTGSHNGTNHGATAATGKIDGGAGFVSASSQYIDGGSTYAVPAAITVSAWVNATSFPNAYNTIGGPNSTPLTGEAIIYVKSTGKLAMYVKASTQLSYDGSGTNTLSSGTWYYITLTYSSSAGLIGKVNAGSDGTAAANGALNTGGATYYIGQDIFAAGRFWNGTMDELRIASVARSADWISTEYNNQSAPGTFETLGTEVAVSTGGNSNFFMFFPS